MVAVISACSEFFIGGSKCVVGDADVVGVRYRTECGVGYRMESETRSLKMVCRTYVSQRSETELKIVDRLRTQNSCLIRRSRIACLKFLEFLPGS